MQALKANCLLPVFVPSHGSCVSRLSMRLHSRRACSRTVFAFCALATWTEFGIVKSAPRLSPIMRIFAGLIAMAGACGPRQIILTIVPCLRLARAGPRFATVSGNAAWKSGAAPAISVFGKAVMNLFMMRLHRDRWKLRYTASLSMPNEACKICANVCEETSVDLFVPLESGTMTRQFAAGRTRVRSDFAEICQSLFGSVVERRYMTRGNSSTWLPNNEPVDSNNLRAARNTPRAQG